MVLQLRDYQAEALAAIKDAESRGVWSQLVVLPTGTGKTILFGALAFEKATAGGRVLILVHREELVDLHVRAHFVAEFPGTVWIGWLEDLYAAADVDVAVWLFPEDRAAVVRRLTNRIVGLQAQLDLDLRRGNITRRHVLERDIQEADMLRARVQWGEDKVFSAAVLYTVNSTNSDCLEQRASLLQKDLEGRGAAARSLWLRQVPGLVSVSPAGNWQLGNDCTRLVNLGAAVGFYPFGMADMSHPGGVLIGTNKITGGPVFYNSFARAAGLTNPHVGIFAQSGAGKTAVLKVLSARSVVTGIPVVVLDWEREYVEMARNLGGHVVRLESGQASGINPLDLEEEEADADTAGTVNLQDKMADVRALVAHMVALHGGSLQPEESALLDRVVYALYADRGIGRDAQSLYEEYSVLEGDTYRAGRRKKPMPRLSDLHARMKQDPGCNAWRCSWSRTWRTGAWGCSTAKLGCS